MLLYNANVISKQDFKYRIGRHARRKARKHLWVGILVLLLIGFGIGTAFIIRALSNSGTEISMPEPITREYAPLEDNAKEFDQEEFTIKLPQDWRLKSHEQSEGRNLYQFQSTEKHKDNRWLEIYVNSKPQEKAFNRLLPLTIDSNQIIVVSSVSDNCTAFTGSQGANKPSETGEPILPAKWQGVSFLCDMANFTRNVVGVGTEQSGHELTLRGQTKGETTFYVVYIDHSISPDYQILERALESIEVK